ncbi:MAG: right-handed parallel beta-helix repeat-containing protein [Pirellulaceae bacterium]
MKGSETLFPRRYLNVLTAVAFFLVATNAMGESMPWQRDTFDPAWARTQPRRTKRVDHDPGKSDVRNGAVLLDALNSLEPGDQLKIAAGRFVVAPKLTLDLQGTPEAPIWIMAADPEDPPTISRPDARQNLMNVGEHGPSRYVALRHLELTGGSVVIRFYDCAQVWLDRCELHHGEHGGITVNSRDTNHIHITRNHMHHFMGGTGEGMYLGANHGKVVMRNSVVAGNHVHHCGGRQGDGIELKQGSYNNWIVENHVHDTQYPCLIAYGTGGQGVNMIERNTCYRSNDNAMQVQGEAIVRNNLVMAAKAAGFASTDHQGKTRNLRVLHNTIITSGRGANLSSWDGREGMIFANNALYTADGPAVRFPNGAAGVTVSGNVVHGAVQGVRSGTIEGNGLGDFQSVSWDAHKRNAAPAPGSPLLGGGDQAYVTRRDLRNRPRRGDCTVGALILGP